MHNVRKGKKMMGKGWKKEKKASPPDGVITRRRCILCAGLDPQEMFIYYENYNKRYAKVVVACKSKKFFQKNI